MLIDRILESKKKKRIEEEKPTEAVVDEVDEVDDDDADEDDEDIAIRRR